MVLRLPAQSIFKQDISRLLSSDLGNLFHLFAEKPSSKQKGIEIMRKYSECKQLSQL